MLTTFPTPVLSIAADAVRDLEGRDALSGLWTCMFLIPGIVIHMLIYLSSVYEVQRIPARRPEIGEHLMEIMVLRDDARRFKESTLSGESEREKGSGPCS